MARLDATAVWFERGEDAETVAATEYTESRRRRVPTLAWIAGGVILAMAAFAVVVLYASHASASRREAAGPRAALALIPGEEPRAVAAPGAVAASVSASAAANSVSNPSASSVAASSSPAASEASHAASSARVSSEASHVVAAAAASTAPERATSAHATHGRAASDKSHHAGPVPSPDVLAAEKLLRHGRAGAALARFQVAIVHDGTDGRALRGACMSLAQLSRLDDAARVCRRALERDPSDVDARRALAGAYYDGGAYKWSAAEWRRVVAQEPHDAKARRALHAAEARAQKG
jgi:tetratricopeptide (TPR) repeat protein